MLLVDERIEVIAVHGVLMFWLYVFHAILVFLIELFARCLLLLLKYWVRINAWLFILRWNRDCSCWVDNSYSVFIYAVRVGHPCAFRIRILGDDLWSFISFVGHSFDIYVFSFCLLSIDRLGVKIEGYHYRKIDYVPEGEYKSEYCKWCHTLSLIFYYLICFHTDKAFVLCRAYRFSAAK